MGLFRKIKDPVEGVAQITAASGMPEAGTGAARCTMHLAVQVPGIDPYSAELTKIVRAKRWPIPGMTVPVTVDRRDPSRIEIDWDRVPTREELARQQNAQVVRALGDQQAGTGGIPPEAQAVLDQLGLGDAQVVVHQQPAGTPGTQGGAAAGSGGDDRISRLERLADLHRSGALTDEEFAAEKAKLLGG